MTLALAGVFSFKTVLFFIYRVKAVNFFPIKSENRLLSLSGSGYGAYYSLIINH